MKHNICIVYSHHKLGDLIWQLPYIKSISDHHDSKITLVTRKTTQSKDLLADLDYIENFYYNNFRKGIFYWLDVAKLYIYFKKNKFTHVYLLDKISRPAIAARFAKVENIIGPGIKNQKKWLNCKKFLDDEDWNLNYSEQSQKFLKINNIEIKNKIPNIKIDNDRLIHLNKQFDVFKGKKIALGIDSFENYKMWPEEYFAELAEKMYESKLADYFYLVCGPKNAEIAKKIIKLSNKKIFLNCSNLNLLEIAKVLQSSLYFIGNNSGPLNLSAALNIKSFGLFANSPISQLRYTNIITITPKDYVDNLFIKNRDEMKKLSVEEVFNKVKNN